MVQNSTKIFKKLSLMVQNSTKILMVQNSTKMFSEFGSFETHVTFVVEKVRTLTTISSFCFRTILRSIQSIMHIKK